METNLVLKETPITFVENLTVLPNYYYILNGVRKLWAGNEVTYNPSWDDENFIVSRIKKSFHKR